jgi:glutamate 5-kinase
MRVVIKFGTNLVASQNNTVNRPRLLEMVRQMARLHAAGHQIALVSSGAIFVGRRHFSNLPQRKDIPFKQMLAAIGQVKLLHIYEQLFDIYNITIAQALLTRGDLSNRGRYLNARNTLNMLLERGVVPVVNENDVVGVEEIKIGDNDNLSALIANLVDADLLLILTDQPGLFTADPRTHADAELIAEVPAITDDIRALAAGSGTHMGVGGMITKLQAAELATRSGVDCVIASGHEPDVLLRIVQNGEALGTRFRAKMSHIESRKRWIITEPAHGILVADRGAKQAVVHNQRSLLSVGILSVEGNFARGDIVILRDEAGNEIGRGVVNYGAQDIQAIKGRHSKEIEAILGYNYGDTIIHRDNLVVTV